MMPPPNDFRFPDSRLIFSGRRQISKLSVYPGYNSVFDPNSVPTRIETPIDLNTQNAQLSSMNPLYCFKSRWTRNERKLNRNLICGLEEFLLSHLMQRVNFTLNPIYSIYIQKDSSRHPCGIISIDRILFGSAINEVKHSDHLMVLDTVNSKLIVCVKKDFRWDYFFRWFYLLLIYLILSIIMCSLHFQYSKLTKQRKMLLLVLCVITPPALAGIVYIVKAQSFALPESPMVESIFQTADTIYYEAKFIDTQYFKFEDAWPSRKDWNSLVLLNLIKREAKKRDWRVNNLQIEIERLLGIPGDEIAFFKLIKNQTDNFVYFAQQRKSQVNLKLEKLSRESDNNWYCSLSQDSLLKDTRHAVFDNKKSHKMKYYTGLFSQNGLLSFWDKLEYLNSLVSELRFASNSNLKEKKLRDIREELKISAHQSLLRLLLSISLFNCSLSLIVYLVELLSI